MESPIMQLYKKCSTIKVHFLSGRVTEESTDRTQWDERTRLLGEVRLPDCTPDTHVACTLVKLSVVKATIFQLSSLNPV